tara:strand:- start:8365 stop:8775 length:411 start_codon:yes stop_codon:yes gene_type:complete
MNAATKFRVRVNDAEAISESRLSARVMETSTMVRASGAFHFPGNFPHVNASIEAQMALRKTANSCSCWISIDDVTRLHLQIRRRGAAEYARDIVFRVYAKQNPTQTMIAPHPCYHYPETPSRTRCRPDRSFGKKDA